MARLAVLLRLELIRRLRDPVSLLSWFAIPFVLVILMIAAFGPSGGGIPKVKLLIVDHDDSFVSGLLSSALGAPQMGEVLEAETVDSEEGQRLMQAGKTSLMVEVPEGFGKDYLNNEEVTLTVHRNPQEDILPAIGEDVIRVLADGGAMLRGVLAPLLDEASVSFDTEPDLAQVTDLSTRIYKLLDDPAATNLVDFRKLKVERQSPGEEEQITTGQIVGWFAPGMVAMALLFMCNGQSQEIQEDLNEGRLARAWSYPTAPTLTVMVKAVALILSSALTALLLVAAFVVFLGWQPGNVAILLVHLFATAAAFTGIALFLRSLTRNPEAGGAAASGVMVGMGFLGGCFMPVVFLPSFLRTFADYIPTGWAVQGLHVLQGADWAQAGDGVAWRTVALLVTALVTSMVASRLMLRKAVAR
ncbi:MAG: ABC transporter permease [bacterium]|nr:ABC transporter permease [bacterium]